MSLSSLRGFGMGTKSCRQLQASLLPRRLAEGCTRRSESQHGRPCAPGPAVNTHVRSSDRPVPRGVTVLEVTVQHIGGGSGQRVSVLRRAVAPVEAAFPGPLSARIQARFSVRGGAHTALCLEGRAERLPRREPRLKAPEPSLLLDGGSHALHVTRAFCSRRGWLFCRRGFLPPDTAASAGMETREGVGPSEEGLRSSLEAGHGTGRGPGTVSLTAVGGAGCCLAKGGGTSREGAGVLGTGRAHSSGNGPE